MLRYQLSQAVREAIAQDEPAVKAALSEIANEGFGTAGNPKGISKAQGGIVVNGKPIVISSNKVYNDFTRSATVVPEEQAVIDAISQVASIVEAEGVAKLREEYGECRKGDPLRHLQMGNAPI